VSLAQIRSAAPEIFQTQTKKSDSAKKRILRSMMRIQQSHTARISNLRLFPSILLHCAKQL